MRETFTHRVLYSDGSESLVEDWSFLPITVIHAERQFKRPITPMLAENFVECWFYGVWWTLQHRGQTSFGYDKWLEFVDDLERVDTPAVQPVASEEPTDPKPLVSSDGDPESS